MTIFSVSITILTALLLHSHMMVNTTQADEYWHLHHSDWRNTLIYVHTILRTLPTCDIRLGW